MQNIQLTTSRPILGWLNHQIIDIWPKKNSRTGFEPRTKRSICDLSTNWSFGQQAVDCQTKQIMAPPREPKSSAIQINLRVNVRPVPANVYRLLYVKESMKCRSLFLKHSAKTFNIQDQPFGALGSQKYLSLELTNSFLISKFYPKIVKILNAS